MITRQEYWKSKGYTDENIQIHLKFERRKSKQSRDKRKKNNEVNKEIIKTVKQDLVGQVFKTEKTIIEVLSVSPSVDGVGFWYKIHKTFSDNSKGEFRYFYDFNGYSKKEFIKWLKIS